MINGTVIVVSTWIDECFWLIFWCFVFVHVDKWLEQCDATFNLLLYYAWIFHYYFLGLFYWWFTLNCLSSELIIIPTLLTFYSERRMFCWVNQWWNMVNKISPSLSHCQEKVFGDHENLFPYGFSPFTTTLAMNELYWGNYWCFIFEFQIVINLDESITWNVATCVRLFDGWVTTKQMSIFKNRAVTFVILFSLCEIPSINVGLGFPFFFIDIW